MMKCSDVENYLDDYIDATASSDVQAAIETHLAHCDSCQQALAEHKAIRHALLSLPVVEASNGFEAKVFSAVRHRYGESSGQPGNRFIAGFATAMVASLALWFASTLFTPVIDENAGDRQMTQTINLAMNQTRTVKLVFEAKQALSAVTLSIELPENIDLEGYEGQKQLVWQTRLNKGQNILALPVIATHTGQGELMAKLSYGDKTKQFHIVLNTDDSGAQYLQIIRSISA